LVDDYEGGVRICVLSGSSITKYAEWHFQLSDHSLGERILYARPIAHFPDGKPDLQGVSGLPCG
jgi:hypothetical protein